MAYDSPCPSQSRTSPSLSSNTTIILVPGTKTSQTADSVGPPCLPLMETEVGPQLGCNQPGHQARSCPAAMDVNSCFILLIILQKSLHEPMYICLCNLFMNALLGTVSFYPSFLYHLLSDTQVISYEFCYTQIGVMYTYIMGEMTILTVMAYDRYVAIYLPLKYNTVMTCTKLYKLLFAAWIYPVVMVSFALIFSVSVPLCGNQINKLYCHNWDVLKLSCVDTTVNNILGFLVYASFIPLFSFTVYSYIKILMVCHNSSKEHNRKALQTCLPHLISLISFYATVLSEIILSRLNPKNVLNIAQAAYQATSDHHATDYNLVKQAILRRLNITTETHRAWFREYRRAPETRPRVVAEQLCDHIVYWLTTGKKTSQQTSRSQGTLSEVAPLMVDLLVVVMDE
ncbi:olfactory receptor 142-like [Polyodon spathula]|uniref:olfactory receptor 142-like n=1 Tax=Polyodon spathula TaxID=7913 RepID=UPI001B7E9C3D|nr:olfactory receptor 142-like [Polyodon spathula]